MKMKRPVSVLVVVSLARAISIEEGERYEGETDDEGRATGFGRLYIGGRLEYEGSWEGGKAEGQGSW